MRHSQTDSRPYVETFDLVRGYCALAVAVYHALSWSGLLVIESLGTFTVYTFFVLSAATMQHVYADRFRDHLSWDELAAFYKNRAARIFPLLAASALGSYLAALVLSNAHWAAALPTALLTATGSFGLQIPGVLSNTTGAWSLGIELVFYAVYPMCALALAQTTTLRLLGIFVAVLALQQMLLFAISEEVGTREHWGQYVGALTFAPFFCMGFIAHRFRSHGPTLHPAILVGALGVLSGFSIVVPVSLYLPGASHLFLLSVSGASVWFAYRSELPKSWGQIAEFFGRISYSLYLTHWFVFEAVAQASNRLGIATSVRIPIFLTLALLVAHWVNIIFERPARAFFRARVGSEPPSLAREPG